ncbi:glycoside hydrolase family 3 protein [Seiridium cupressi]
MVVLLGTALSLLVSGVAAAGHLFPDCENGPLVNNTVCDTSSSVSDRAKALVAAFTTEEKFQLVVSTSPGVPRLGLPSYEWWQEALHGVASSPGVQFAASGNYSYATSFPQPILMGAAFDDSLIEAVATVVSTEARAFNNANRSGLDYWTPNINPYRDPRWGRGQETPGEDPFHIKSYVKALIKGLQGDDPNYFKVVATCKHFAGYDIENWNGNERYEFDAIINPQELSEYYMQPFKACARDAKVASIMCSYNALNGVPTCASSYILQDVLRGHWNWTDDGFYVVSDCDAVQNVYMPHNYSPTREGAAADSLVAGTDLNCGTYYQLHLPAAYDQGLINDTVIDQALVRLYAAQIRLGVFDPASSTSYRALAFPDVNTPEAQDLALKAAEEGIVLIKNDGVLPISVPTDRNLTLALIGSWANATAAQMQGNYAGIAPFIHNPLYAASQLPNVNVLYGGSPGDPTTSGYPAALDAASGADIIIYVDGSDSGESNDRNLIRWSGEGQDIMLQIAGLGKPFILLQMGDQLDDAPFLKHENVSAIMWAGFPGQAGGDAIMNIITGKTAPAGRLPVTQYPADYVNQVPMTDMGLRPDETSGNPGRTYQWYGDATVPFGYGLHYTSFGLSLDGDGESSWEISDLLDGCEENYKDLCSFQSVAVTVKNTGAVTSDFTTLGFIAGEYGPSPYPIKQLVAYQRSFGVAAGLTTTAYLNLTLGSLGLLRGVYQHTSLGASAQVSPGYRDRDPYKDPKYWDTFRLEFENIFWDKEGHHLIQHPPAVYHAAKKAIGDIAGLVAPYVLGVPKDKLTQMLNMMFENVSMSVSWNHGKILAVGGKTMMTGGVNYWPHYTAKDPRKIIGVQSVVTGDATISAHLYAEYFWNYTNSMAADSIPWTSTQQDNKIPLFKNTNARRSASDKGLIPVLSVARMGDWHGSTFTLDYPVQIFDGMRDVLDFVEAANKLSDDGPYFKGLITGLLGYSPASVRLCNQSIVGTLQEGATRYDSLVAWAKGNCPNSGWDGKLVPYDLLLAIAKDFYRVRDEISNDSGVFVVLAAHSDDQLTAKKCGDTVDKKLQLKRVEAKKTHGTSIIHTKTYCIDHDLLYIGSDNPYPSYNEEHGIWVEDQAAISSWRDGFWDKLWSDTEAVSKDEK